MRMRRNSLQQNAAEPNNFTEEIEQVIKEKGLKNAVCIVLGANDEIQVVSAYDDSVQLAGILDLGRTCFHGDVLSDED